MTDLVGRLRRGERGFRGNLPEQAADEIERLRGVLRDTIPAVESYRRKHQRSLNAAARRGNGAIAIRTESQIGADSALLNRITAAIGVTTVQPKPEHE